MKIAIIGAGITGLTAALRLTQSGYDVYVLEKQKIPGGLAYGFKEKEWNWYLEAFYHHIFTNDHEIINLASELGLKNKLIFNRPTTSTYLNQKILQLDSPLSLLQFSEIPFIDRVRTGLMIGQIKLSPSHRHYASIEAEKFIIKTAGTQSWQKIWQPLLYGKFGPYANSIGASWFWARIKKRTTSLGYFQGGFQTLIQTLINAITANGGKILVDTNVQLISPNGSKFSITNSTNKTDQNKKHIEQIKFDKVLITTPSKIANSYFPKKYYIFSKTTANPLDIPHLHAQVLILITDKPLLQKIYWLNINDRSFPFLSFVAHTNFMDSKYYNHEHISYLGNYLPTGHKFLSMDKNQIIKEFIPYIYKINPQLNKTKIKIINSYLFTGYDAQPVHQINYDQIKPSIMTSIPNIYLANLDSIYPWDRGTNYAVELGHHAASVMQK